MKDITIEIKGVTPLLCHNVQLADPDNEIVCQIKAITNKRKKTPEDRRDISKLEWHGGLYLSEGGPAFPVSGIKKCLLNAAKITKQGSTVQRALLTLDMFVPIAYEGPRDPAKLFLKPEHHFRVAVGIQGKKTMRTRPQFPKWAMVIKCKLLDNVLDIDDFKRIVELAGMAEGVGDGRSIGFGKFQATVKAA